MLTSCIRDPPAQAVLPVAVGCRKRDRQLEMKHRAQGWGAGWPPPEADPSSLSPVMEGHGEVNIKHYLNCSHCEVDECQHGPVVTEADDFVALRVHVALVDLAVAAV